MYRFFFRFVLSRLDAERAHTLAVAVIRLIAGVGLGPLLGRFTRPASSLAVTALGLNFRSPFGVAAGFDKEGTAIRGLGYLGFGHVEVGTITARPQAGNAKPRLFRLIIDRAVINRMGFNNHGAAASARVISKVRSRRDLPIIGINIGKSRVVDLDGAIADYLESTRVLAPIADYLVVNVSSPNTPGLRGLQELEKLTPLLAAVKAAAGTTPVLVKIAPDVSDAQARQIARVAAKLLDGIIATNTTVSRASLMSSAADVEAAGAGGLSGPPVAARSLELLRLIRAVVPKEFCVISVGGVESAHDVAARIAAGATLVQGYTAFLYRGPMWARQINRGLTRIEVSR